MIHLPFFKQRSPASEPYGDYHLSATGAVTLDDIYDGLYGFYTLEQSVKFNQNQVSKYYPRGIYTIRGTFTRNTSSDPSASGVEVLKNRYNALVDKFASAARSSAPEELSKWGTSEDSRCVNLPSGLFAEDAENKALYARPVSINFEQTPWNELIKYTAVLQDIDFPPSGRAVVNSAVLDGAIITVNASKPRISSKFYAFANSSEIYFGGYDPRSYNITGSHAISQLAASGVAPDASGQLVDEAGEITSLLNGIADGVINIKKRFSTQANDTTIYSSLYVDQQSVTLSTAKDARTLNVSITATE